MVTEAIEKKKCKNTFIQVPKIPLVLQGLKINLPFKESIQKSQS